MINQSSFKCYILLISIILWVLGGLVETSYFSNKHCSGFGGKKHYEISCVNITDFPIDLPETTGSLEFSCSSISKNLTEPSEFIITSKHLQHYQYLTKIKITRCHLTNLPDKLFSQNLHIQSVTFEFLPIRRLHNIFHGIAGLIELRLHHLPQLEHINSQLLRHQRIFSRLSLVNTPLLPPRIIIGLLYSVKSSIKEIKWHTSTPPGHTINIPLKSFSYLRLGSFSFENNQVNNWEFLRYLKARKIILTNTKSSFITSRYFSLANYTNFNLYTQKLNLANVGIYGQFPITISGPLQYLDLLILRDNQIDSLHDNIDLMFPNLEFLDLTNNRIVNIQSNLQKLFYNIKHMKIAGNPLHCNCQLKWLFSRYKLKIRDQPKCRYGFTKRKSNNDNNSLQNKYFSQLSSESLICIPPQSPTLSLLHNQDNNQLITDQPNNPSNSSQINSKHSSDKINDSIGKVYTLFINSDTPVIGLSCETRGDPTPTLTWSNKSGIVFMTQPPNSASFSSSSIFTNKITLDLNTTILSSPAYICTATNIEGTSFALMKIKIAPNLTRSINTPISDNDKYERINNSISNASRLRNKADSLQAQLVILSYIFCIIISVFLNMPSVLVEVVELLSAH